MIIKRLKRKYYIIINILLVFFLSFSLVNIYTKKTSSKITEITETYYKKEIDNDLNNLVKDVRNNNTLNEILKIYKNKDGEILYVDYDLNNTYKVLDIVTSRIKKEVESGEFPEGGIVLKLPFYVGSNNIFLNNLGPKITVKINYIDSILANIYTKVTNYGLNNALVEAYIKINIDGQIITPITNNKTSVEYDLLISSKIINGRVPEFYGNYLTSNSSVFDIPFNK